MIGPRAVTAALADTAVSFDENESESTCSGDSPRLRTPQGKHEVQPNWGRFGRPSQTVPSALRPCGLMVTQVHPGTPLAFFEVAATLIPLLLFGGVVADRLQPKDSHPKRLLKRGLAIAVVGAYAIGAEGFAIDALVTGEWTQLEELLAVTFLIGEMVGVVAALVHPWYARLKGNPENRTKSTILLLVSIALISVLSVTTILETLSRLEEASKGQFLATHQRDPTEEERIGG